jgi:hypothetical protein
MLSVQSGRGIDNRGRRHRGFVNRGRVGFHAVFSVPAAFVALAALGVTAATGPAGKDPIQQRRATHQPRCPAALLSAAVVTLLVAAGVATLGATLGVAAAFLGAAVQQAQPQPQPSTLDVALAVAALGPHFGSQPLSPPLASPQPF